MSYFILEISCVINQESNVTLRSLVLDAIAHVHQLRDPVIYISASIYTSIFMIDPRRALRLLAQSSELTASSQLQLLSSLSCRSQTLSEALPSSGISISRVIMIESLYCDSPLSHASSASILSAFENEFTNPVQWDVSPTLLLLRPPKYVIRFCLRVGGAFLWRWLSVSNPITSSRMLIPSNTIISGRLRDSLTYEIGWCQLRHSVRTFFHFSSSFSILFLISYISISSDGGWVQSIIWTSDG